MSLADATIMATYRDSDKSAEFTVSFADDDHRFSASVEGDYAIVQYEETLGYRGDIRIEQPDESIFKTLMVSDEMTTFLDRHNLDGVRRAK